MRSTRVLAPPVLLGIAAIALACASSDAPEVGAEARAERLEYERDHERCILQAENTLGVVQRGDYVACMESRGWKQPPSTE